tara:strand:- start:437 stop:1402 length:966 start_codon:yes stop_codon:yes gene_type:complete
MTKIFGLDNLGSTCYLNSTLQCLLSFDTFRKNLTVQNPNENMPIYNSLVEIFHSDRRKGIKSLIRSLMKKVNWFRFLQHNDINEFITLFFDQLNIELAELKYEPPQKVLQHDGRLYKFMQRANKSWDKFVQKENSWFNDFSTGQVVNQIICGNCGKIHHNYETFRVLDVEIPENSDEKIHLHDCLHTFFAKYHINCASDEDKWKCDACGHTNKSLKSCKIVRAPDMLIIALKRFKQHSTRFIKNNIHVEIPKKFNTAEYAISDENFQLKAVANHMGGTQGGHYNAFTKHGDQWYMVDDEDVRKVRDIDDSSAYTIFYEKII